MTAPTELAVKIKAMCSVPRLGFNDHFGSIFDTLRQFNIPLSWYTGAFWEKCIQSSLEDCIDQVDWILTIDYDTLTTPRQLREMMQTFGRHPEMDALAAYQPRRNTGMPLMTVKNAEGVLQTRIETCGPFKVSTAHFGLTLIRASSLKTLSKPWFLCQPSSDGSWRGDDVIDADIYFWKKWESEGKTVYVHPDVLIGHLEAMVSLFEYEEDEITKQITLKQKYISANEWRARYANDGAKSDLQLQETR